MVVVGQVHEAGEGERQHDQNGREGKRLAHSDDVRLAIHDAEVDGQHHEHEEEKPSPGPERVVDGTILACVVGLAGTATAFVAVRSGGQPFAPRVLLQSHRDSMTEAHQRLFQHPGLLDESLEPPVIGMHGTLQSQVVKAA